MHRTVEHLVFVWAVPVGFEVLLDRGRVDEEMRGLHQTELFILQEKADGVAQHVLRGDMVAVQEEDQLPAAAAATRVAASGPLAVVSVVPRSASEQPFVDVAGLGVPIGFAREVAHPQPRGNRFQAVGPLPGGRCAPGVRVV